MLHTKHLLLCVGIIRDVGKLRHIWWVDFLVFTERIAEYYEPTYTCTCAWAHTKLDATGFKFLGQMFKY